MDQAAFAARRNETSFVAQDAKSFIKHYLQELIRSGYLSGAPLPSKPSFRDGIPVVSMSLVSSFDSKYARR